MNEVRLCCCIRSNLVEWLRGSVGRPVACSWRVVQIPQDHDIIFIRFMAHQIVLAHHGRAPWP